MYRQGLFLSGQIPKVGFWVSLKAVNFLNSLLSVNFRRRTFCFMNVEDKFKRNESRLTVNQIKYEVSGSHCSE